MKNIKKKCFERIKHLIMLRSNISDVYFHKYPKIKIHLDDDLLFEKKIKYAKYSNTY